LLSVERSKITIAGRAGHRAVQLLRAGGRRFLGEVWDPARLGWAERVPVLPDWARRSHRPRVWSRPRANVPEELRTVPGVERDEEREAEAFAKGPLHFFFGIHPEATKDFVNHGWEYLLPTAPRYSRSLAALKRVRRSSRKMQGGNGAFASMTPTRRSAAIRDEAARIGLSAVGFAPYDPKYAWREYTSRHQTGSVIVCVYEQDHAATQTAPSSRAERAAFFAYAETMKRVAALAEFAQARGAVAQPHGPIGEALVIPYAIRAGLGQLGLNGQLLTPTAGSRVRVCLITTDLELEHDEPVDYGIPAICDECQICVRRCPVGAIPLKRAEHRGIVKAKIKTERCFPVVARVEGCAVCMKTCPVQRYGLDAVIEHRERTGEILGKGSDELEGYHWPPDGRHYPPGQKPPVTSDLIRPKGWQLDVTRTAPPQQAESATPS
jgi:epoxyqueuosine reductase